MLDVRRVNVVGKGDEVIVSNPEPGWQEVKVDKLSWRPQQPFGNVQFAT